MREEILRQTRRYLNRMVSKNDLEAWLSSRRAEILGLGDIRITLLADQLELMLTEVDEGTIPEGEFRRQLTSIVEPTIQAA